ncbi:MAG TPA: hypothetical protein VD967_02245 [Candidatus Paceibacterota bacterium]|nr:hypothetical protein [Candidatus Paceibacterota bacterium]
MEFSLADLLKRIALPTPKRELGGILESYLASKGITSRCAVSSLSDQVLYLKTDSATRQYLHQHKQEALSFLQERAPQHHILDIA